MALTSSMEDYLEAVLIIQQKSGYSGYRKARDEMRAPDRQGQCGPYHGLSVMVPETCFDCLLFAVNRSLD